MYNTYSEMERKVQMRRETRGEGKEGTTKKEYKGKNGNKAFVNKQGMRD